VPAPLDHPNEFKEAAWGHLFQRFYTSNWEYLTEVSYAIMYLTEVDILQWAFLPSKYIQNYLGQLTWGTTYVASKLRFFTERS
jgi:hypothetical protein